MIKIEEELGPYWEVEAKEHLDVQCNVGGEDFKRGVLQVYYKNLHIFGRKFCIGKREEHQCYEHAEVFE